MAPRNNLDNKVLRSIPNSSQTTTTYHTQHNKNTSTGKAQHAILLSLQILITISKFSHASHT